MTQTTSTRSAESDTRSSMAVLDSIRDALEVTIASVERQEDELAAKWMHEPTAGAQAVAQTHALDRIGERLADWQDRAEQAFKKASQAEIALMEHHQAVQRWQQQLQQALTRLQSGIPNVD